MEMKYYIRLPNNTHKEVKQEEYTKAFSNKMRIVKQTQVGSILVSTVFLGIDLEFWLGQNDSWSTVFKMLTLLIATYGGFRGINFLFSKKSTAV